MILANYRTILPFLSALVVALSGQIASAQNPLAAKIEAALKPNGIAHDADRDGTISVQIESEPEIVLRGLGQMEEETRASIDTIFLKSKCSNATAIDNLRRLPALKSLHIEESCWHSELARVIGDSKTIQEVWAQGAGLVGKDLESIGNATQIKCLMIDDNQISGVDLAHLANLKELRQLSIPSKGIKTQDLMWLSGAEKLFILWLDDSDVDDGIFDVLAPCKSLKILNVRGTKVTEAALSKFYEPRPPAPRTK